MKYDNDGPKSLSQYDRTYFAIQLFQLSALWFSNRHTIALDISQQGASIWTMPNQHHDLIFILGIEKQYI